jgi:hypothetical protein
MWRLLVGKQLVDLYEDWMTIVLREFEFILNLRTLNYDVIEPFLGLLTDALRGKPTQQIGAMAVSALERLPDLIFIGNVLLRGDAELRPVKQFMTNVSKRFKSLNLTKLPTFLDQIQANEPSKLVILNFLITKMLGEFSGKEAMICERLRHLKGDRAVDEFIKRFW